MGDLSHTLDLVRGALLSGDLDQLAPLTRDIEDLLSHAHQLPEHQLALIRAKASRNAAHLTAAIQGVRAAQRRMNDLREASTGHRTYGPGGARTAVANVATTLKQRI
jgi:hypothetical protein